MSRLLVPKLWLPGMEEAPWAGYERPPYMGGLSLEEVAEGLYRREIAVLELDGRRRLHPAMGANVKSEYGTDAQAITTTLASLANAASRESATVDNTSNKFLDALVMAKVKTNATAPAGDKAMRVYCWGSVDYTATATFPDAVTGADAGITLQSPTQLQFLGMIFTAAASTSYIGGPWSIASRFGGRLPAKWGLVFTNNTGNALDATGTNFEVQYQGIYATVV